MNDTIYRQAALDEIDGLMKIHFDRTVVLGKARNAISALPSVQSERKKGEWIYGEHDIAMCDGYWCDQCGFFVPWDYKHKFIDFIKDYHWCPSCGADMRGDDHG